MALYIVVVIGEKRDGALVGPRAARKIAPTRLNDVFPSQYKRLV